MVFLGRRREFITLLGGAAAVCFGSALAQQPGRVWRIGILHGVPPEASIGVAAFRQRLGELGYLEGQNTTIEYRWSDQADRLPLLAAALIEMKVDIIVVGDGTTAKAAKQATREIPIVAAVFTDDPVAAGLAVSLGHPGGNVTGISLFAPEMSGKRLELLRDIVPHLTRVAVLWTPQSAAHPALLRAANQAAHQLGIELVEIAVSGPNDIENAFDVIMRERVGAVAALQGVEFYRIRARIAELGLKYRMPIITGEDGFARLGGLVQYGPSPTENWRQAANYLDKILKGSKPADLPIAQPTIIELIINLRTAKALGLDVPLFLQQRADEVIE
jgi:putative tryptophan/tyrosine transport system substrate-binding protein